ncbi:hypothetical protein [Martelella sp. FOR1707]
MASRNFTVLEFTVKLKYDWENLSRNDLARIAKVANRWMKRAKYGGKIIGMLVVTDETAQQFLDRIRSELDNISVVDDFWCQTAGSDGVGKFGVICPFQTAIAAAWEEAGKRNKPKKVSDFRTQNIWLKNGVDYFQREAAVKMGLKRSGERKPKK